jgi:hypothetical protein
MNPSANRTANPAGIIGMPGWFDSESVAGFVGIRMIDALQGQ